MGGLLFCLMQRCRESEIEMRHGLIKDGIGGVGEPLWNKCYFVCIFYEIDGVRGTLCDKCCFFFWIFYDMEKRGVSVLL